MNFTVLFLRVRRRDGDRVRGPALLVGLRLLPDGFLHVVRGWRRPAEMAGAPVGGTDARRHADLRKVLFK